MPNDILGANADSLNRWFEESMPTKQASQGKSVSTKPSQRLERTVIRFAGDSGDVDVTCNATAA